MPHLMIFVMKIASIVKVSADPKQKYSQRKGVQGIILFARGQKPIFQQLYLRI